ncbi:ABC transporter permease [Noviherbaspirillum denitrificans]|uniref:Polyamine ABC transporter substrate-binding protein n=1 Tax=Noviherbaspirillum denitrificans TaxID=1968433 RepID=A0A254TPX7_9BURK|nr:ABC transporter permease [Noviherbaspirillum denitrificans]OWW21778.1 polyamine ABC transporter substrate-binding protein [Noviherbaspirillum denitrificans]
MNSPAIGVAFDTLPAEPSTAQLKRELRAAQLRKRMAAIALIAPLMIFLLVTFVAPIVILLKRAVENPEVVSVLPKTVQAIAAWDRHGTPSDETFAAFADDLAVAKEQNVAGVLARRINAEIPGSRSVIMKTSRAMPRLDAQGQRLKPAEVRQALVDIDEHWGQPEYWQAIARNGSRYSPYYLLASMDLKQDGFGNIEQVDDTQSAYRAIFARTFMISLGVTLCCLLLGYPLAYWLSTMSERRANLFMILVLIPFWTSILVRVAAWMVLLQAEGLVNKSLMLTGLIDAPLELLFNRTGTYISMTHILLPFMILPMYSVMKSIPPSYMRAAVSLGSHPFAAFWRVYVPQTAPGVGAGALLVFILALGYYITPALLGGTNEQMVSYYVAYFINVTINWGMACALGTLLFAATLLLYGVYRKFAKIDVSMG